MPHPRMTRPLVVAALAAAALAAPSGAHAQSGGTEICGKTGGGYTIHAGLATSCPFARNTARQIRRLQRRVTLRTGQAFRVFPWSSATKRRYRMRCTGSVDRYGAQIMCFGGDGAMVIISRYR